MIYNACYDEFDADNDDTLGQERRRLDAEADNKNGTNCRCCQHKVTVYTRAICARWCDLLQKMYREHGMNPVHVERTYHPAGKDWSCMKHLGYKLIEECPNDDETKFGSGFWKITNAGVTFCEGRTAVPAMIFTLLGKVVDASCDTLRFNDAMRLRTKHDVRELHKKCTRLGPELFQVIYGEDDTGALPGAA